MSHTKKILAIDGIEKNFNFIILEVTKQVEDTAKALEKPGNKLIEKIDARDDYIDNLKSVIENKCYYCNKNGELDKKSLDIIRSVNIITNNLERIADFAVNIVNQQNYLQNHHSLINYEYKECFKEVIESLGLIKKALIRKDVSLALKICKAEFNLDNLFVRNFRKIIIELRTGENTENLVTILFILRYLERMGDSLLNIGEAIIFAIFGDKLKIHDFDTIEESIKAGYIRKPITDLSIESILETKSGCKIKRVHEHKREKDECRVLFKEGRIGKIEKERDNIILWEKLKPGIPPKVFNFQKNKNRASLLLEYLNGSNLQQIILSSNRKILKETITKLKSTVSEIWKTTLKEKEVNAGFIRQLTVRIEDIYKTHQHFDNPARQIGSLKTSSFSGLIDSACEIEKEINAPFSVFIHGDFNADNIIFDRSGKKVHFVDLYRSGYQDYVQDISVFLISNFRIPILDSPIRDRLNEVILSFYKFGRQFASEHGDETFNVRLALGLARSFTTSTRFEFNKELASTMYLRAVFLLEKIIEHNGRPWADFKVPEKILIYQ